MDGSGVRTWRPGDGLIQPPAGDTAVGGWGVGGGPGSPGVQAMHSGPGTWEIAVATCRVVLGWGLVIRRAMSKSQGHCNFLPVEHVLGLC